MGNSRNTNALELKQTIVSGSTMPQIDSRKNNPAPVREHNPGNRFPETQSQPANTIPEIEPRKHNSGNRKLGTGRKQVSGNFQASRQNTIDFNWNLHFCMSMRRGSTFVSGNLVVLLFCPSNIENKAQSVSVYLRLEGLWFRVQGSGLKEV